MRICTYCGHENKIAKEECYPLRKCLLCEDEMNEGDYVLPNLLCPYHNYFHGKDEELKKEAKLLGSKGGKKRAENSTLEQRKEWGKKGGRPVTKNKI